MSFSENMTNNNEKVRENEARERAGRRAAVERFEAWRAGWKGIDMSLEEILAARHEGHRY